MGMWHIFLTFFAATAISVIWIIQGLDGAPRRFSVLPSKFDQLTDASIPLVILLALAQLLLVWNIVQTLRGKTSSATQREVLGVARPRYTSASLQGFAVVVTLLALFGLAAAGWAIGGGTQAEATSAFLPPEPTPAAGGSAADAAGLQVFMASGCAGCHVLGAANATGTVGPNLDETKPSKALVIDRVTNGAGAMPAFGSQLTPDQIEAVAEFVSDSAGESGP